MLHNLSRTLRKIHHLSRDVPVAEFQDAAFEAMKELIRFDAAYWGGGRGPIEAVVTHYHHRHNLPVEMDHTFEKAKSSPEHIALVASCVINAGQAQVWDVREAGVGDLYSQYGVDQIISLYTYDTDLNLYQVVSLYRSGAERFTETERQLFEGVVPHLLDTWRENNLLHLSSVKRDSCPLTPAAALLDKEGVVHFARPAFVELLRREWPEWRGPFVPEVMRRKQQDTFVGKQVVVHFIPQHTSQNSFILATVRNKGLVDQLTARELAVAKQLVKGASHKEIALSLGIASATARNHIANIYTKLGTNKGIHVAVTLINEGVL